jgi:hypothetical protein
MDKIGYDTMAARVPVGATHPAEVGLVMAAFYPTHHCAAGTSRWAPARPIFWSGIAESPWCSSTALVPPQDSFCPC